MKKNINDKTDINDEDFMEQQPVGQKQNSRKESKCDAVDCVIGGVFFMCVGLACELFKFTGDLSNGYASSIHSSSFYWQVIGGVFFVAALVLTATAGYKFYQYKTNDHKKCVEPEYKDTNQYNH
jgi:hypothetical protein